MNGGGQIRALKLEEVYYCGVRYLTANSVARLLRVHHMTVNRWASQGKLKPSARVGMVSLYAEGDVLRFDEEGRGDRRAGTSAGR